MWRHVSSQNGVGSKPVLRCAFTRLWRVTFMTWVGNAHPCYNIGGRCPMTSVDTMYCSTCASRIDSDVSILWMRWLMSSSLASQTHENLLRKCAVWLMKWFRNALVLLWWMAFTYKTKIKFHFLVIELQDRTSEINKNSGHAIEPN